MMKQDYEDPYKDRVDNPSHASAHSKYLGKDVKQDIKPIPKLEIANPKEIRAQALEGT